MVQPSRMAARRGTSVHPVRTRATMADTRPLSQVAYRPGCLRLVPARQRGSGRRLPAITERQTTADPLRTALEPLNGGQQPAATGN